MDDPRDATTITEGYRALDLFVDRVELCRRFLGALNDDPARVSVTVLHGDGGNGKSLLLEYLRTRLARRFDPDNWTYLASLPDAECVAQAAMAEDTASVPSARLDFDQGPRDGFGALLKLRRDLADTGLRFPLVDFAVVTYLHKSHQPLPERIREIFPVDEIGLALEFAQLVQQTPGVGIVMAFMGIVNRRHGAWFERYCLRRNLDDATVAEMLRMDHETELRHQLPRLFAEDLNAAMPDPEGPDRVAFFFDNHSALVGHERDLPDDLYFQRDEWLRRFIMALDPESGVTVMVSGRELPRWAEAPRLPIFDVDRHHVGDLSESDALAYLELAGIGDHALQQQLCDDARVVDDQIHPMSLGLGADLALAAARDGRVLTAADLALDPTAGDRRRMVVERLLRYVSAGTRDAVRAVATCRHFDVDIYRYLGKVPGFPTSPSGFSTFVGFSFIQRNENETYRVHNLIRRFGAEAGDDTVRQAHEAMAHYYSARATVDAGEFIAEAIYHIASLDWRNGFGIWWLAFQDAYLGSRFSVCEALLDVARELPVEMPGAIGLLRTAEGQYFQRLSRFGEAKSRYLAAIAAFDQALHDDPGEPEYLSNKGNALVLLSDVELALGNHAAAEERLQDASIAFDGAMIGDLDNVMYTSNKANALTTLGKFQFDNGEMAAAGLSYQGSETAVLSALLAMPEEAPLYNNLGLAKKGLADVRVMSGDYSAAERLYRDALRAFDDAIQRDSTIALFHSNKGTTLHHLAKTYVLQRRRRSAALCYRSALSATHNALRQAPQYLLALYNTGLYCEELGTLLMRRSRNGPTRDAQRLLRRGITALDKAAALAPDDVRYPAAAQRLHVLQNFVRE
jgi:tetratricopeptide (TPR) repeat protein